MSLQQLINNLLDDRVMDATRSMDYVACLFQFSVDSFECCRLLRTVHPLEGPADVCAPCVCPFDFVRAIGCYEVPLRESLLVSGVSTTRLLLRTNLQLCEPVPFLTGKLASPCSTWCSELLRCPLSKSDSEDRAYFYWQRQL